MTALPGSFGFKRFDNEMSPLTSGTLVACDMLSLPPLRE
jgi:hypothetical protein